MRVFAIVVLLLAGCASAPLPTAAPATSTPIQPTPSAAATPDQTPTATATPAPTLRATPQFAFGDGTHLVPADVAPGTYRTVGYTERCYWTRLGGFESGLEDWLASAIGPGYHVVTIGPDDAGFDSRDCTGWTADLSAVTASRDVMGEGTYIVGTDIEPGEWSATSGDNCYWARLSGFGGTQDEVVAEELTSDGLVPVVSITATDIGFTSNGCGEWSAIQP